MANHIKLVEQVEKEVSTGLPDGMDTDFLKKIPVLFKRIRELENALAPLARVYYTNSKFNLPTNEVYMTDLKRAYDVLDPAQSLVEKKTFFYPA